MGADGNAPRALTSLPLGTVLQTAVGGNTQYHIETHYHKLQARLRAREKDNVLQNVPFN